MLGGVGTGCATSDQLVPFQRSMIPGAETLPLEPTAKQLVVLRHATPCSPLAAGSGLGLVLTAQLVPFQRSMNVCTDVLLYRTVPTAKQLVVLGHDRSSSQLLVAPAGFGLATIDHAVPFHRSTSVFVVELVS